MTTLAEAPLAAHQAAQVNGSAEPFATQLDSLQPSLEIAPLHNLSGPPAADAEILDDMQQDALAPASPPHKPAQEPAEQAMLGAELDASEDAMAQADDAMRSPSLQPTPSAERLSDLDMADDDQLFTDNGLLPGMSDADDLPEAEAGNVSAEDADGLLGPFGPKPCSLCGVEKELKDFGPKKGSKDGKDCYCRICGSLRRRYTIPVVRQAVKDGTLGDLLAKHAKSAPPKRPRRPAGTSRPRGGSKAAAGGTGSSTMTAAPASGITDRIAPGETIIWCCLCASPKPESQIAITVGDEPFCNTCDHVRRRANNLGMSTREVTQSYKCGSLAGFLGLTPAQLAQQLGQAGAAATAAASVPGSGGKAGTLGRMCRSCRQVRAPIVGDTSLLWSIAQAAVMLTAKQRFADGVRLSYCTDCEVIKGRVQARGFSIAQLCDAFERNALQPVFGDQYHFIIGGTRFDPTAAQWAGKPAATPAALTQPARAAGSADDKLKRSADGTASEDLGPGKRRKREQNWAHDLDDEDEAAGEKPTVAAAAVDSTAGAAQQQQAYTEEQLATIRKRCALCKGIKPLAEYPSDNKKLNGRACYCIECKRLRCRAQSYSKEYSIEWLRAALLAGELRERLGEHAEAVLNQSSPHKPLTTEISPDADAEWSGDERAAPRRSGGSSRSRKSSRAGGAAAAPAAWPAAAADNSGANNLASSVQRGAGMAAPAEVNAAKWNREAVEAAAGYCGTDAAAFAQQEAHGFDNSEETTTIMTRRVLMEHREFLKMYCHVRDQLVQPGLSPEQVSTAEETAAELELHMQEMREVIGKSFVGA